MDKWDPLKLAKESKTFCVLPWVHQFTDQMNNIHLCCLDHADPIGKLSSNSFKELWNSKEIKDIRLDMLAGKKLKNCNWCNDRVDLGILNPRNKFNKLLLTDANIENTVKNTNVDGSVEEHKLFYLDIRFNNLCNLSCRTCGDMSSSTWAQENKKIPAVIYPGKHTGDYYTQILEHLDTVKQIYFAGGEPLIQKEHYMLLDELIKRNKTNCQLRYNTNLSKLQFGGKNVLEYWKQFDTVIIGASIDGNADKIEYWRNGCKWSNITENLKQIQQLGNVKLGISYTFSWPNSLNLFSTHKELVDKDLIKKENFGFIVLSQPLWYSIDILPKFKKESLREELIRYSNWILDFNDPKCNHLITVINFILKKLESNPNADNERLLQFAKMTKELDLKRKQNFWETYPEHLDMKEYIELELGFKF